MVYDILKSVTQPVEQEPAIRFDHVSKKFVLHPDRGRSLQETVLNLLRGRSNGRSDEFWALRDVTFDIARGETVGLIGPNGAGKSTVLKLISRIIEPTSGQTQVNGQVSALLELGAGFHPNLTGRENIYLNGSILGLSRSQIEECIEEIIDFAELNRFIDVPVKHYSSGMYVRLGFSVAVHTDPDVLLVDEVLAVGDAAFQQKCLDRIAAFRRGGCTVLFVSHNLDLVQQLCTQVIWLEDGRLEKMGQADRVIANYMALVEREIEAALDRQNRGDGAAAQRGELRIREVKMVDEGGEPRWSFHSGDALQIRIAYESTQRVEQPVFSILIHRSDGLYVSSTNTYNIDPLEIGPIDGDGELIVDVNHLDLHEGEYFLSVGAYFEPDPPYWATPAHFLDKEYEFRVISEGRHGVVVLPARWEHHPGG